MGNKWRFRRSIWGKVMVIAMNHEIPARGYHPVEIISMLKSAPNPLIEQEIEELKALCVELGFDYDKIRAGHFIRRKYLNGYR